MAAGESTSKSKAAAPMLAASESGRLTTAAPRTTEAMIADRTVAIASPVRSV